MQACAIVVYLASTLYDSSKFRSNYGLEVTDGGNSGGDSQKWQLGRLSSTTVAVASAVVGAAAGAGAGSG